MSKSDFEERMSEMIQEAGQYLPCMALHVSEEGKAVSLYLDTSDDTYTEHIPGEGADIGLMRRQSDNRVVGVRLPLYRDNLAVSHQGPIRINTGFKKGDTP